MHNLSINGRQGAPKTSRRGGGGTLWESCVMLKKTLACGLIVATMAGTALATTGAAEARNGRNAAFAAGAAAGVIGGALLGGALSNRAYAEPYYYEPEPVYVEPEPVCYWRKQRVPNTYDAGWHWEKVQVCR
jgi:hypothetical protein